jgi:hypothetical protein
MSMRGLCGPIERSITITLIVTRLQDNFCTVSSSLNQLPCNFCVKPIGEKRPIAIGIGRFSFDDHERGLRLCNNCYNLFLPQKKHTSYWSSWESPMEKITRMVTGVRWPNLWDKIKRGMHDEQ